MKPSDAELLLLFVQQRSESAFRELVERHQGLVFSICCRRLGDSDLAADATQNVFLALASKANQLEPGPLAGYLAKTAIYVCSVMRQARAARERHEQRYRKLNGDMYLPSEQDDERSTQLRQAMSQLSDRYREPLTLRYIDGLSVEAVGVAMDLSRHAVKKRLVRALAYLREQMEAQGVATSTALAVGMLRRMHGPAPAPGLAEHIVKAIFSAPPASIPFRVKPLRKLLVHTAMGATAAATTAAVVTVTLLPRSQPAPPPARIATAAATVQPASPSQRADPLSFKQRIGRKLPGIIDEHARFDFTLTALSTISHVPIEADWDAIEARGISRRTHILLELHDKTVLEDLDAILAYVAPPGILEYVISDGRIIVRPRPVQTGLPQAVTLDH
jgi:RNA polymerase sigma factor (sigma-70 family)